MILNIKTGCFSNFLAISGSNAHSKSELRRYHYR